MAPDVHRPIEKGHVSEGAQWISGLAASIRARLAEDDDRKIRPGRLRREELLHAGARRRQEYVLGQKCSPRAGLDRYAEAVEICADQGFEAVALEELGCDLGVTTRARPDQHGLAIPALEHQPSSSFPALRSRCGTPVRIPRNSCSGSPTCSPRESMRSSRSVSSWAPERFLTTAMALRTCPDASK